MGGGAADLHGRQLDAAELLSNRGHLASRDTLHVHLGERQREGPLTTQALFQGLRIEAAIAHLGHIKGNLPDPRGDSLGFVAVSIALTGLAPLIGRGTQVLLAFGLHGVVNHNPQ